MTRIGVISDTHGLLRPEAVDALRGVAMILHAGDIGKPEIIEELKKLAPVAAVRGNNDVGDWALNFPDRRLIEISGVPIYMLHDVKEFDASREDAAGARVIVAGHSHKPIVSERDGVLYLNPGSAGPRRFKLPVTVALLDVDAPPTAEIIHLLEDRSHASG